MVVVDCVNVNHSAFEVTVYGIIVPPIAETCTVCEELDDAEPACALNDRFVGETVSTGFVVTTRVTGMTVTGRIVGPAPEIAIES